MGTGWGHMAGSQGLWVGRGWHAGHRWECRRLKGQGWRLLVAARECGQGMAGGLRAQVATWVDGRCPHLSQGCRSHLYL